MTITLEQAKQLKYGQELWHVNLKNADKTPMRVRVSGKVKTWKKDQNRVEVPLKYGLYGNGYLTNGTQAGNGFVFNLNEVNFPE